MADFIHLIRHGQSTFNAAWERDKVDPMIIDAPLTERGKEQAADLPDKVANLGVEAVLSSPLTRALQTADGLAQALNVPLHVDALHREFMWSSCDIGRPPAHLSADFPHLNFDHLPNPWWWCPSGDKNKLDKEPLDYVKTRVDHFLDRLRQRPERSLAVVGHCTFFWLLTGTMMQNCEVLTLSPHTHQIPPDMELPPGG